MFTTSHQQWLGIPAARK